MENKGKPHIMRKHIYLLFSIPVLLAAGSQLKAQSGMLGFYLNGSRPLNEFKDSNYRNGLGFSIEYLSRPLFKTRANWFEVRLGLGWEYFYQGGKKADSLIFNTPNEDQGFVEIKNEMQSLYIGPKFVFNLGRISPYVDVFGAMRTFTSWQKNEFYNNVEGYEKYSNKRLMKTALGHAGASVGFLYNLSRTAVFDFRVSYTHGGAVSYVNLPTVGKDPDFANNIKYQSIKSPVSDMLIFRVGINLRFHKLPDKNPPATSAPTPASTVPASTTPQQPAYTPPAQQPKPRSQQNPEPAVKPAPTPPPAPPKKPAEVKPIPKPAPAPAKPGY